MSVQMSKFFRTKEMLLGGGVNLMSNTIKMILLGPGFIYHNSMVRYSDIVGLEIAQTLHYPAGGLELIGKDITTATDTGKAEFRVGTIEYPKIDDSVYHVIIYAETTAYGIVNPLLCYGTFAGVLTFKSSVFMLSWPEPLIRW